MAGIPCHCWRLVWSPPNTPSIVSQKKHPFLLQDHSFSGRLQVREGSSQGVLSPERRSEVRLKAHGIFRILVGERLVTWRSTTVPEDRRQPRISNEIDVHKAEARVRGPSTGAKQLLTLAPISRSAVVLRTRVKCSVQARLVKGIPLIFSIFNVVWQQSRRACSQRPHGLWRY